MNHHFGGFLDQDGRSIEPEPADSFVFEPGIRLDEQDFWKMGMRDSCLARGLQ